MDQVAPSPRAPAPPRPRAPAPPRAGAPLSGAARRAGQVFRGVAERPAALRALSCVEARWAAPLCAGAERGLALCVAEPAGGAWGGQRVAGLRWPEAVLGADAAWGSAPPIGAGAAPEPALVLFGEGLLLSVRSRPGPCARGGGG